MIFPVSKNLFFAAVATVCLSCELTARDVKDAADVLPVKSAFRDPFWPVGYDPAAIAHAEAEKKAAAEAKKAEEASKAAEAKKQADAVARARHAQSGAPLPQNVQLEPDWGAALRRLKIYGYAESNGNRSCVINGKTVSEGERISVVHDAFRYVWEIEVIAQRKSDMRFARISVEPKDK